MTRSVTTWTVVVTWLSVTRPAPVWGQASITASRSAHLVMALLLPLITPASSASIFGEAVSDPGSQVPVYVDQFNNVGVFNTSSRKLKHDIQPMDKASETLYQFKPVTFKYNSDWKGTTQYGLIAEEVAEVDPQLVVRGRDGEIMAVHYEQINNMLLNEFLKEHKKVEELRSHRRPATERNGSSDGAAQRAGRANQKVSAQLGDEQASGESGREQTLAVVHHNYGIMVCS